MLKFNSSRKWFYKALLGLWVSCLFVIISNPFSFKTQNILKSFVFLLIFSIILALLLSTIETLFYKYESNKLYRIRKHFKGQTIGKDVVKFSLDGIDFICVLIRTSETNNFSKLKFNLAQGFVHKKRRSKLDFIIPTKIENMDCFQIYESNGLLMRKVERDLIAKINLIRRLNVFYKTPSTKQ